MRNRKDLKMVRFALFGGIQLDMERVEQDPAWAMAGRKFDLADPKQFDRAMVDYVKYYLGRELVLAEMPVTTGPAELYGLNADGPNQLTRELEEARDRTRAELSKACLVAAHAAHETSCADR